MAHIINYLFVMFLLALWARSTPHITVIVVLTLCGLQVGQQIVTHSKRKRIWSQSQLIYLLHTSHFLRGGHIHIRSLSNISNEEDKEIRGNWSCIGNWSIFEDLESNTFTRLLTSFIFLAPYLTLTKKCNVILLELHVLHIPSIKIMK